MKVSRDLGRERKQQEVAGKINLKVAERQGL